MCRSNRKDSTLLFAAGLNRLYDCLDFSVQDLLLFVFHFQKGDKTEHECVDAANVNMVAVFPTV